MEIEVATGKMIAIAVNKDHTFGGDRRRCHLCACVKRCVVCHSCHDVAAQLLAYYIATDPGGTISTIPETLQNLSQLNNLLSMRMKDGLKAASLEELF